MFAHPRVMVSRLSYAFALFCTFALTGELTARIEDRVRFGVPLAASPSYEDLLLQDEDVLRGRPNARFQKWQLNEFGFRNASMTLQPAPGCRRIMVLGASESFGLYESAGKEYPAQLAALLKRHGCFEVINAAVAGLSVRRINALWSTWGARFDPEIVVIYPSPAFYLGNASPAESASVKHPAVATRPWWRPRLLNRAKDRVEYPAFWQRRRVANWLADAREGRPHTWFFEQVPTDRLHGYAEDLDTLVTAIRASGAKPMIVTHATGFHDPPHPDELDALDAWRSGMPRVSRAVALSFETAAARLAIDVARRYQILIVDAAAHMNGHRQWFARDFIHLTDEGAAVLAGLIAERVVSCHIQPNSQGASGAPGASGASGEALRAVQ